MSSSKELITILEKLLQLHKSLLAFAMRKTEYIKVGDMEGLNLILKKEQSLITAIQNHEYDRQTITMRILPSTPNPSVSDCLEVVGSPEKNTLVNISSELNEVLDKLKEQNNLNKQLINQSLQYVNVLLNLVMPQPGVINYGPPKGQALNPNKTDGLFNFEA